MDIVRSCLLYFLVIIIKSSTHTHLCMSAVSRCCTLLLLMPSSFAWKGCASRLGGAVPTPDLNTSGSCCTLHTQRNIVCVCGGGGGVRDVGLEESYVCNQF